MPDMSVLASVAKLLDEQEVRSVRLTPASRSCRQSDEVVLLIEDWNSLRQMARSRGVVVAANRDFLGREEAARFGAALRAGMFEKTPPKSIELVLGLLARGEGLVVAPMQGDITPSPLKRAEKRVPQRTNTTVVLESGRDPQASIRLDYGVWASLIRLAADNGHAVQQDHSLTGLDACLLAAALRRGGDDWGGDRLKLERIIAFCETGEGIIVTKKQYR